MLYRSHRSGLPSATGSALLLLKPRMLEPIEQLFLAHRGFKVELNRGTAGELDVEHLPLADLDPERGSDPA